MNNFFERKTSAVNIADNTDKSRKTPKIKPVKKKSADKKKQKQTKNPAKRKEKI